MLTRDEATDLLTFIQGYDNRAVTAQTVASWVDASAHGRWTFDDAVTAVRDHFATTTEYLMPGHITAYARAQRSQPPPLDELRKALPSVPAASQDHINAKRREVAEKLGWPDDGEHKAGLRVVCPWCHAQPGEQCTRPSHRTPGGRARNRAVHPSRVDAANQADAAAHVPAPRSAPDGPDPTPSEPHSGSQPRADRDETDMLKEAHQ